MLRPLYLFNTYALLPLALLLLLLLRLKRSNDLPAFRPGLGDLAMVLFVAGALASILFEGESHVTTLKNLTELDRVFLVPFAAFWLVRVSRIEEPQLAAWVPILAGLCILEAVTGALGLLLPTALPRFWPGVVIEMGGLRVTGTMTHPDGYVAMLVLAATFCFHFLSSKPGLPARAFGSGLLVIGFSAGFVSFSRASWIGSAVALGLLATAYRRRLAIPVMAIVPAVVLLSHLPTGAARVRVGPGSSGAGTTAPSQSTQVDRKSYAIERLGNSQTVADRVVLGAAGVKMFLDKPLLGWGFGSYDRHARGFIERTGPFVPSDWDRYQAASHNSHISILAELGIVGYACLAFPLAWVLVRSARALWYSKVDRLLITLWANMAFLVVISMSIDLRFLACTSGLAWLILGLVAVRVERHERPC